MSIVSDQLEGAAQQANGLLGSSVIVDKTQQMFTGVLSSRRREYEDEEAGTVVINEYTLVVPRETLQQEPKSKDTLTIDQEKYTVTEAEKGDLHWKLTLLKRTV